jgi:hypothetical protein
MIEHEFKKNYLTMIENGAKGENHLFRNFYIIKEGIETDALENGGLSCAAFVSSILYLQNSLLGFLQKKSWISFTRATVASLEKDLLSNGWYEIKELRPGAVLIWEKQTNEHVGFCVSETEAVSNDSQGSGFPCRHFITYNGTRKVEKILWHPELDNG